MASCCGPTSALLLTTGTSTEAEGFGASAEFLAGTCFVWCGFGSTAGCVSAAAVWAGFEDEQPQKPHRLVTIKHLKTSPLMLPPDPESVKGMQASKSLEIAKAVEE